MLVCPGYSIAQVGMCSFWGQVFSIINVVKNFKMYRAKRGWNLPLIHHPLVGLGFR